MATHWRTARLIGIAGANADGEPGGPIEVTDTRRRDRELLARAMEEYGTQFAELGHAIAAQLRKDAGGDPATS